MKKDTIFSLKSLLIIKEKINFLVNSEFVKLNKIVKITNCKYETERKHFKISPYKFQEISLKTNNLNQKTENKILIKHSIFNTYIKKYKITNTYLIKNIEEYYRLTKVFINLFNKKYGEINEFEIETNHNVIFTILKYREKELYNIEQYKFEKIENIFSEELYYSIIRL